MVEEVFRYVMTINWLEAMGLVFGLVCVLLLIKESIWTWPTGIAYVLVSFVIFFQAKLYADLALHVFFLVLNIYGWYYWLYGKKNSGDQVPVTSSGATLVTSCLIVSFLGIGISGFLA